MQKPEQFDLLARLRDPALLHTQAYVGGKWQSARHDDTFAVADPATGTILAHVPAMGAIETREAIAYAEDALAPWKSLLAKERARILRRWADLVLENTEDLAIILTAEQGKPLAESRAEIAYAASFLEWFAEEAKRVYGDTIPTYAHDRRLVVLKQPIGVTGGITPWNFPSAMITRKAAPALAAGCTMVLKPAEQTPLSALALCELAERAGLPAGVLNMVTASGEGAPAVGSELTGNPAVRKLGFTGSTAVGRLLMAQCAKGIKKISLELGGNAPFIVFDDADFDAALDGVVINKFRNSGQTCITANRIFVQDSIYDRFVAELADRAAGLKVASGFDDGVAVGPLIDDQGFEKVVRHVADAVERGGRIVTGGDPHALGGTFFQPTVIADVTTDATMSCEETFGPIAGVIRFRDEAEAVRLANDTPYGLSAYFYSRDIGRVWRVAEALDVGIVGVNTGVISSEVVPFGGVKESGIGREGSRYGIDEWLEVKYLNIAGIDR
ncbi:MAG: NAD-dependent succinate-semialdehyde dehydrogenase [Acidimicrobiales bacterium]